jgi:hypothetical protein
MQRCSRQHERERGHEQYDAIERGGVGHLAVLNRLAQCEQRRATHVDVYGHGGLALLLARSLAHRGQGFQQIFVLYLSHAERCGRDHLVKIAQIEARTSQTTQLAPETHGRGS